MISQGFRHRFQRCAPLLIFAINLLISWRLLNQEYTTHYDSIEPFFYALAAHIRAHWLQPGWWGEWNCGLPFRYTYQPGLHTIVALTSALTGWSAARAFHFALALLYSAGPVTLFFLVRKLASSFRIALAAALLYSLCSPSTWLIREIDADTGGPFHATLRFGPEYAGNWAFTFDPGGLLNARRLHTAIFYGDAPYVVGLTLLPLALLLLHNAAERSSPRNLFFAALGLAAVPLVNIPATLTLAMAVLAYLLVAEPTERFRRAVVLAACSMAGYLLVAPLIPLSALSLAATNTQWMDPEGRMSASKLLSIGAGLLLLIQLSPILRRLKASPFARFAIFFFLITGVVVLGKSWGNFSLVAQPTRFHLAMEMAIAMSLAALTGLVTIRQRWAIAVTAAMVCFAVVWQIESYRLYARKIIKREPVWDRSEYKIAKWMDRHADGKRVWVPGSVSFWLNAFTTTPQLTGCCDQNFLFQAPRIATYEIGTDDGAGSRAAEISLVWMKTMGVKYFALSGARSMETYHVTHHPDKFKGVLTPVWHSGDDAIYEVPGPSGSLAHWIAPGEVIREMPINGVEIAPLEKYTAAVSDSARPQARLHWDGTESATIQGTAQPGGLLSVQIPFHSGWRAESTSGTAIPVGKDALGFLLLNPKCDGDCTVRLIFDGGLERKVLIGLCLSAWIASALILLRPRLFNNKADAEKRV